MQSTLVDSGPLIALFDRDDRFHAHVVAFLRENPCRLHTTWPVLTEVCALLGEPAKLDFLAFVAAGGVAVENLPPESIEEILELSRKYSDRPMDFADASLVVLSQRCGLREILSVDADFDIYRLPRGKTFRNLLTAARHGR
ncbi:MAG TPA: PIN domain-containing protein [Rhodocyclaceae bacterium]|nr:PIN domain-containing protein [Rhodocyclaceae bacterium]